MNFKISEAVKLTGLTAHAIRYYTDKGLVRGMMRDEDNNRIFSEEALNYLRAIRFLRLAGLSILKSNFIILGNSEPSKQLVK